jgi:isopentenyldiphosphate isomerase/intracellular septation protein A
MNVAIRNLLYAFFPLLAYVVADYYFGLGIGLSVVISLGMIQLFYDKLTEKIWNKLLIIDLLLILVFSSVSFYLNDDSFFKWKALALEIFTLFFLVFIYRPKSNYLAENLIRFKFNINREALILMRRQIKRLIFLIFLHSILLAYTILFLSDTFYIFVVGPFFYGLIIIIFIVQFFEQKFARFYWQIFYKDDEKLPIIDKNGTILFIAPRKVAHKHPEWIHPTVHLLIVNKKKEIYLQKRSKTKHTYPLYWDSSVGGHVKAGQTIEEALKQESLEELGINLTKYQFVKTYLWYDDFQTELVYFFITNQEFDIKIDPIEICDGKYWSIKDIYNESTEKFTKHLFDFELVILNENKKS